MLDLVTLIFKAGDGGHGRVSFRREKFIPKGGPDGGDGGKGGNIILRGKKGLTTLKHFAGKTVLEATRGQMGGKKQCFGSKGEDLIVEVPFGTVVWLIAENQASQRRRQRFAYEDNQRLEFTFRKGDVHHKKYYLQKEGHPVPDRELDEIVWSDDPELLQKQENPIAKNQNFDRQSFLKLVQIDENHPEVVLCQGGYGGRGNVAFKSSTKTTPLEAEYGSFGEQKKIVFELRLLADVGLVGFPNAGKSTLLSKVTRANPKIANYPFTTIEPNLGIMSLGNLKAGDNQGKSEVIIADLPGLIEGASEGKGLGHTFLRHVENCQVLLFILYLDENLVFDETLSWKKKADLLWQQYLQLDQELKDYSQKTADDSLLKKPRLFSLNKTDIYPAELVEAVKDLFKQQLKGQELIVFSGVTGEGLEEVKKAIAEVIK